MEDPWDVWREKAHVRSLSPLSLSHPSPGTGGHRERPVPLAVTRRTHILHLPMTLGEDDRLILPPPEVQYGPGVCARAIVMQNLLLVRTGVKWRRCISSDLDRSLLLQ